MECVPPRSIKSAWRHYSISHNTGKTGPFKRHSSCARLGKTGWPGWYTGRRWRGIRLARASSPGRRCYPAIIGYEVGHVNPTLALVAARWCSAVNDAVDATTALRILRSEAEMWPGRSRYWRSQHHFAQAGGPKESRHYPALQRFIFTKTASRELGQREYAGSAVTKWLLAVGHRTGGRKGQRLAAQLGQGPISHYCKTGPEESQPDDCQDLALFNGN